MYQLWLSNDGPKPGTHVPPLWGANERRRYSVVTGHRPTICPLFDPVR